MERLKFGSSARVTKSYEDGARVTVSKIEVKRPIPGSIAKHEAAHVVAAGRIVSATIVPSGEALGTTQPVKMTATAAAAAEALGHDGTGWDMYLTEHVLGVDPNVAKSAARATLSGKGEELHEVATLLQERRTIGQSDVEEARQNVKDRSQGIFPIKIEIMTPDGRVQTVNRQSFQNGVSISDLQNVLN